MQDNEQIKIMGHDVINSLTKIIGGLKLAEREEEISDIKKYINTSMKAAVECVDYCQVMMAGPNIISLFTDNFFKNFISEYQTTYPNIHLTYQSNKVHMINVDINLLKNSIHNIIKNSEEAGATKLAIIVSDKSIKFTDNGHGVNDIEAKKIKEKGSTKNDLAHHGIGMYSLAHFCKTNKFELSFYNNKPDSEFKHGFTVEFKLLK